jgi:hypothetical protein
MNALEKYCHNCGKKTTIDSKFCGSCGTSLTSIDSKPPSQNAKAAQQNTFTPVAIGRGGDDDDNSIRADRVNSLSELGIDLNNIDISVVGLERNQESIASVVAAGGGLPQGYKEPARIGRFSSDPNVIKEILKEGASLRQGESIEIKG